MITCYKYLLHKDIFYFYFMLEKNMCMLYICLLLLSVVVVSVFVHFHVFISMLTVLCSTSFNHKVVSLVNCSVCPPANERKRIIGK